jgi:uncharacterized protein
MVAGVPCLGLRLRNSSRWWLAVTLISLCVLASSLWAQAVGKSGPTFPELSGRVVDQANVIPPDIEAQLTARLAALEAKSTDQLVVVTVTSLQSFEIEDYGYKLGRHWQIGQGERLNNGVILLVAPNERKVRIEVGYGLEGVLTDYASGEIIRDQIVPKFKAGDVAGGIVAGVDGIETVLTAEPAELEARAKRGGAGEREYRKGSLAFGIAIAFFFFAVFFSILFCFVLIVVKIIRAAGTPGALGATWRVAVSDGKTVHSWDSSDTSESSYRSDPMPSRSTSSRSSSDSSSSSSGSSFSGGGGSFGGGGASGSW